MKVLRLAAVVVILVAWGQGLPARAQGAVTLSIDSVVVDRLPEIEMLVTVRDANGIPITGLNPEQFELVEDGRITQPPDEVTTRVNPEATISTMLVVDVSGSMRGKPIDEAKKAAISFVDQLGAQDRAGIIAFGDRLNVDLTTLAAGKELDFTTDKNAVRNVVDLLDTKVAGDTPLYDGIYKGVGLTAREPVGKRAILVMTDGRDERDNAKGTPVPDAGSVTTKDDPINEASRQGIPIFAIGLGNKIDSKYLARLALRTGGQYQETPNPEELTSLFQKVLDQLKQQYVVRYQTELGEDSSFHSLMLRVHTPQGQAFDEVKFFLGPEVTPTAVVIAVVETMPVQEPTPLPVPSPVPTAAGVVERIRSNIESTVNDNPVLAAAIGGGALLLLILIVALIVILARGRRGREAEPEMALEPEEARAALPAAGPMLDVTGRAPVLRPGSGPGGGPAGQTEVAPPGWSGAGPQALPQWGQPPAGPAGAGFQAVEGGTRVIERGPKHLAMLVNKSQPGRKYDLKGTVNVGRSADNDVAVDHPTVSRHHAWVKEDQGEFLVFDVGSANGTFVNDERVEAPRQLASGDIVRFGEVEFVFTKVF